MAALWLSTGALFRIKRVGLRRIREHLGHVRFYFG
jgi:hypothetical protein